MSCDDYYPPRKYSIHKGITSLNYYDWEVDQPPATAPAGRAGPVAGWGSESPRALDTSALHSLLPGDQVDLVAELVGAVGGPAAAQIARERFPHLHLIQ
jgi:hypothetical protein